MNEEAADKSKCWLIAVGAGRWQLSGIHAAKNAGLNVLALDGSPAAVGFRIADRHVVVDIRNPEAVLNAVTSTGIRPSGVASFVTDAGMMSAARVREFFGLPGPGRDLALRLTNKCSQRQVWTDGGLPCPKWFSAAKLSEAEEAVGKLGRKIILKPSDSAGSRGIHVFSPEDPWHAQFDEAKAASNSGSVILENYVVGTEYTVETFADKGRTWILAVSEKRKLAGTNDTVASELATPGIDPVSIQKIGSLAADALMALGHTDGPGHTEILRESSGALWLVEAAGRGGGFMVADGIVPRASGFDLATACALQAVGRTPAAPNDAREAFVLRFLPTRRGVVTSVEGFEKANRLANVECQPLVVVGDVVEDARNDGGRLAYIFSWAPGRDEAFSIADEAERCIDIKVSQG